MTVVEINVYNVYQATSNVRTNKQTNKHNGTCIHVHTLSGLAKLSRSTVITYKV